MKSTIFEKYQVRKTRKQKSAFIEYVKSVAGGMGYDCKTEKGTFGARNIVVGDPDSAKVIYTAHYDTCSRMPFPNFITPKNIGIYILFNIAIVVVFIAVMALVGFAIGVGLGLLQIALSINEDTIRLIARIFGKFFPLLLLIAVFDGPANKNTANDNTSGVMTLLTLMKEMPADQREKCAFVFFDLEEMGLFGSAGFSKKHKDVKKNTLVINFDCVSDGDNFIFTLPKTVHDMADAISDAYASDLYNVEVLKKGYIYPSDQMNFKKGVGVASLKKSKRFGLLYMDRIHTKKDTVYQEENITHLVNGSIKLTQVL